MEKFQERLRQALARFPLAGQPAGFLQVDREIAALAVLQVWLAGERPLVALTATAGAADALADGLRAGASLLGLDLPLHQLPELEGGRLGQVQPENESERARLLNLCGAGELLIVASAMAALAPVPPPEVFRRQHLCLVPGETGWPPQRLADYLVALDYDNEAEVHLPGEFAWRGGILDVFSPAHEYPLRLEFFGDELESIRFFDPETQRSLRPGEVCTLIPRGERALREADASACFLDYLPAGNFVLAVLDLPALREHLADYGEEAHRGHWRRFGEGGGRRFLVGSDPLEADLPEAQVYRCPAFALTPQFRLMLPEVEHSWDVIHRQFLRSQLQRWAADGYQFAVCCDSQVKLDRFREQCQADAELGRLEFRYAELPLPNGLFFPAERLVLLSEFEIYGKLREAPPRSHRPELHADYLERGGVELHEGDFAVHAGHGICRYLGIRQERMGERLQEVMVLEFQDEAKLFVALDQAYLVSRYVGTGKTLPRLAKIGGSRWQTVKGEAELAVKDLAAELLQIQAMRQAIPGYAYQTAEDEVRAFAQTFPYDETDDQKLAIADVLADLRRPKPMDRLVCGDVGFGKTEVAMRAAHAAVTAGRQVAVLVPTTVLCQQHYLTFRERFKEYPITVESLSRFRTGAEQRQVLRGLTSGGVDVVIGTHRLLSEDLKFKDLGLLIVDEEQRFGVVHKERLKAMRADVDVLTMTATPIPRTLYFSMAGLRDMSTIMTAPLARLPIQTIVAQYDEALIREAILRELQRGGQVFFLHNRVQSIQAVRSKLRALVPEARFDVGHGQMHEHELEEVMIRFLERQTDVLVCTTIIESGLDIPNANTIVIDRADCFGLADLYQLRGRVGRYHRQAYAYLLIPRHGALQANARERLNAIRKFTQLGAGFRLALRDLEIRGAGNILGREQSGHINAVGFSLYCQLLREAVARLKHEELPGRPRVALHLDFLVQGMSDNPKLLSAAIPPAYVGEESLRVELYRRLGDCNEPAQLDELGAELADRFGALPSPVRHLLTLGHIRLHAHRAKIHSVSVREGKMLFEGSSGLLRDACGLPRLRGHDPELWPEEVLAQLRRLAPV